MASTEAPVTAPRVAVRAQLLGDVRVVATGGAVALGGPTNRLMLTLLLLANHQAVAKERLVEAVWGEEPPDAESALRVAVTRLRKRLEPTGWTIASLGSGYRLAGDYDLDVDALAQLEAEVMRAVGREQRFAAALAAVRLWTGPSLGEVRDLDVGCRLAARLDARRLVLRRVLYEMAASAGELQRCAAEFAEWTSDDPLDEVAACAHAAALAAQGRTTAALRHLTRTRELLAEVGVETGRAVADLELRLLTNASPAPSLPDRSPDAFPATLVALAQRPLVGRSTDLAELHRLWRRAESSGMQVVRIGGPAGVGKSSLVAHFAAQLHDQQVVVAYVACDTDSVRPLAAVGAIVGQLLPSFDPASWTAAQDDDDGPAARSTVVELASRDLVAALSRHPTLAVIDDMRAIDELSLAVLRRVLAAQPSRTALLILGERNSSRPRLPDRRIVTRLLEPLGGRALQRWIGRNTNWTAADLQALTGGLPLLVEEALARGRPDDPGDLTDVAVPLFEDHVSGLTETALDTISTAALLGRSFTVGELVAIRALPEMDVVEHLDAAIRRGLVTDEAAHLLSFRHELFRHASVSRWSAFRVARTHAEVLVRTNVVERDPLRAVRHVEQGGEFVDRATVVSVMLRAGGLQMAAKAYGDARRILEIGAARIDGAASTPDEVKLLCLLGTASAVDGRADDAVARFDAALAGAIALGEVELEVDVFIARGALTPTASNETAVFERMVELLGRIGDLPAATQSAFLRQVARLSLREDRADVTDEVRARMAAVLPCLERPEDRVRHWLANYSMVSATGDRASRQEAVGEIMQLVDRDPWLASSSFAALVSEHLRAGQLEQASTFVASALESFVDGLGGYPEWLARAILFTIEFLGGDVAAAEARSIEAHRRGVELGVRGAADTRGSQRFYVGWAGGELGWSITSLQALIDRPFSFAWRCALALALAVSGRRSESHAVLDRCVDEIAEQAVNFLGVVGIVEAAEAAWLCGHQAAAGEAAEALACRRGEHVLLGSAVMDFGPARRYEALCLATLGERERAASILASLATDPASCPMWQLRAAVDLAALGEGPPPADGRWSWVLRASKS